MLDLFFYFNFFAFLIGKIVKLKKIYSFDLWLAFDIYIDA